MRSPGSGSAACAGRRRGTPSPVKLGTCWPTTPSACSTCPCTRPARHSPNPSIRCWDKPSRRGPRSGPRSPRRWTARPASTSTSCSPSAVTPSRRTTSTARSSRRCVPKQASRPPTFAATSPATGRGPRSPASSTTPRNPMTLFELQAWLGHRTPTTTQHYAKISPNTLSKAYTEAGYFARNVRTIEVLIDRDAVTSGGAADGQPWQHYDLGHGGCSYSFFEQCQHRMACARCDFYTPKQSSKGQLLEAKDNLQRMLAGIPLTDDERAAVDDGHSAVDALLARLVDVPTPAGPTPHQIRIPPTVTQLPIIQVTQRDTR